MPSGKLMVGKKLAFFFHVFAWKKMFYKVGGPINQFQLGEENATFWGWNIHSYTFFSAIYGDYNSMGPPCMLNFQGAHRIKASLAEMIHGGKFSLGCEIG